MAEGPPNFWKAPFLDKLQPLVQLSIVVIATVVLVAGLDQAQSVIAPIILALVVGIVLSPVSDTIDRLGLPNSIAALSSLFIILAAAGLLYLFLSPVIDRAVTALPRVMIEVDELFGSIKNSLRGLEEVQKEVAEATNDGNPPASEQEAAVSPIPTVEDALFMAPAILSQIMIFAGALFFFILTKDEIYNFIARRLVADDRRLETAHRLRMAERQVGRYFLTISVINAGYAVIFSAVMMAVGMPSPILWGIAAGLLNFILYLGPALMVVSLLLGGLIAFSGAYSFLPVALYVLINGIEAQFVTPSLVGKTLEVNPLAIFVSLVFFLWLWGAVGGFIAIPLLLWVMVLTADIRAVRERGPDRAPTDAEREAA